MSKKLEGKTAVVTGGTEGIGLATAKLFVEEGAYVFITGRRQKELDEAVKAIGANVSGVQGDVAQLADLDRLYGTISKAKGRIDIVFANAGVGEFVPFGIWWTRPGSNRRPHRCERCEDIHKARCCNHLRLLNIISNAQPGQLRSPVIVKHPTPEGRRAAGREARTFNCFPTFGLGFNSHRHSLRIQMALPG